MLVVVVVVAVVVVGDSGVFFRLPKGGSCGSFRVRAPLASARLFDALISSLVYHRLGKTASTAAAAAAVAGLRACTTSRRCQTVVFRSFFFCVDFKDGASLLPFSRLVLAAAAAVAAVAAAAVAGVAADFGLGLGLGFGLGLSLGVSLQGVLRGPAATLHTVIQK